MKSEENVLYAGSCKTDITPGLPVSLSGQYYKRIAREIHSPLSANVLLLISGNIKGNEITYDYDNSFIIVSCDLLGIPRELLNDVRKKVGEFNLRFNTDNIIINATHIHTGPYITANDFERFWGSDFTYARSEYDEKVPEEYEAELTDKIASAILYAWDNKQPVKLSSHYSHISVAFNRRIVYSDNTAIMYGSTARADFDRVEGSADSGVAYIGFWDETGKLRSVIINLPCPAQILEHKNFVSSDFWHEIRGRIANEYGDDVTVIATLSAAGDLSPRDLVRMACDEKDMYSTPMYNIEGIDIIAGKVMDEFRKHAEGSDKIYERADDLRHSSTSLDLPIRIVSSDESENAEKLYHALRIKYDDIGLFEEKELFELSKYAAIINRYRNQLQRAVLPVEVHCVTFGSVTFVTNPFELFVYYGDKIRSGSSRKNTLIIQLACGYDGYLPSPEAELHGGYSACVCNGFVGSDGGDMLVRKTLEIINN